MALVPQGAVLAWRDGLQMAWLQRRGRVFWLGWRHGNRQFRKSLKTRDQQTAKAELSKLIAIEAARCANIVTSDYVALVTGKPAPRKPSVAEYLAMWLKEAEANTARGTATKYHQVVREFSEFLRADSTAILMEDVTPDQVRGFLAEKRLKCSAATAQGFKRILSTIFLQAQSAGTIKGNPAGFKLRGRDREETMRKRPFTLAEVKTLLAKASPFWHFMVTAGFYTGQSLGDLATLRRGNVDLAENLITLHRRKTNKAVRVPVAPELRRELLQCWPAKSESGQELLQFSPSKRSDYFWPDEAERYQRVGCSPFSQEFYELMTKAGLVPARGPKHVPAGLGRSSKRNATGLGFHNLRHTFVTNLKVAGAMDSVARELAGHNSNAVSTHYTHLPMETLSSAIERLPRLLTP